MKRLFLLLCASLLAARASFADDHGLKCADAHSPIETTICQSPALIAADRDLRAAYGAALSRLSPTGQTVLQASQREWLKALPILCLNRNIPYSGVEGFSENCLISFYEAQILYYQKGYIVSLPYGQKLLRQKHIAANDDFDFDRDPVTGSCMGADPCYSIMTAYYPASEDPILNVALSEAHNFAGTVDDLGMVESDFEIIAITQNFLSIRQSFGANRPFPARSDNGRVSYTVDLQAKKRLVQESIFKPELPWREFIVDEAVDGISLDETINCVGRPNWTPKEWRWTFLADWGWYITPTDMVFEFNANAPSSLPMQPCETSIPLKALRKFLAPEAERLIDWTQNP